MKITKVLLLSLLLFIINIVSIAQSTNRPNVILILADDLGYGDLSCYGQTKFKTPNIDLLANNGVLFTQHYSGAPVCGPSRSTLLTAKHGGHTTIRGNRNVGKFGNFPVSEFDTILPQIFKENGYVTGVFGKWGVGGPSSTGDISKKGVDKFVGYYDQLRAHNYYPKMLWNNNDKLFLPENKHFRQRNYSPNLIHDSLMTFIDRYKDESFFIYMPTIIPHAELVPPDSVLQHHIGKYGDEKKYSGIRTIRLARKLGAYGKQKYPKAAFAAMVSLLDKQVGEIVQILKDKNIYDNTIIIFTSDNGPHQEGGADPVYFNSGGGFRGYKRSVYEGGFREPLVVHWNNHFKKSKSELMSANWDLMPTLLDVINVTPPLQIDGISLLPTLLGENEKQKKHPFLYWEFHEKGGKQAIRVDDWKLIRLNIQDPIKMKIELYNLKEDSSESNDLSLKYPNLVKELSEKMNEVRTPSKAFPLKIDKQ